MNNFFITAAIASILLVSTAHAKSAAFEQGQYQPAVRSGQTAVIAENAEASNTVMHRRHRHHHHRRR